MNTHLVPHPGKLAEHAAEVASGGRTEAQAMALRQARTFADAVASWTAQPKWTPMQLKAPDGRVLAEIEFVKEGFEPDADPQFPWLVTFFDAEGRKSYDTFETQEDAKDAAVKRQITKRGECNV